MSKIDELDNIFDEYVENITVSQSLKNKTLEEVRKISSRKSSFFPKIRTGNLAYMITIFAVAIIIPILLTVCIPKTDKKEASFASAITMQPVFTLNDTNIETSHMPGHTIAPTPAAEKTESAINIIYSYNTPISGMNIKFEPTHALLPTPTLIPSPAPIVTPTPTPSITPSPIAANIKIGDYVQMGKYYDEPILWRCVDIDEKGPIMLSDRILTFKAFDSNGNHKYLDGSIQEDPYGEQKRFGSSVWETSSMRSWLNSTENEGNVNWLDGCAPLTGAVSSNSYANEKGFLAEGNFTIGEINMIKAVTQKSILNAADIDKLKTGGTDLHIFDNAISSTVQNYDTSYYHNVTDKLFLMDIKQLNKVYQNSNTLGENYFLGKPTQKAVDNSDYKSSDLSIDNFYNCVLRTPDARVHCEDSVRILYKDGTIDEEYANNGQNGIRPAFYFALPSVNVRNGNGSFQSPYLLNLQ